MLRSVIRICSFLAFAMALNLMIHLSAAALSSAVDSSVAVSDDGKIIIAIHPYFSKDERKIFTLRGKAKKLLPVGILIQNYSNEKISLEDIRVVSASGRNLYEKSYTPFGDRSLGAIAGKKFFEDGETLNKKMHARYAGGRQYPLVGINEIFYSPWLSPGRAHYGAIYLDERDKKLKPIQIKSIDDLKLNIYLRRNNLEDGYVAELALDDSVDGKIMADNRRGTGGEALFLCESNDCNKLGAKKLYEVNKAFSECYSKSVGKNGNIKKGYWGHRAWAKVWFNGSGDRLHQKIIVRSGSKYVDTALKKVAKGMEHCELPYTFGSPDDEESFYGYTVNIGDPAVPRPQKELSAKKVPVEDPEYLNYQASVRVHILRNWVVPAEITQMSATDRPVIRIIAHINEKGEVISKQWAKKSDIESLNASGMNAIDKSSPFPIPPESSRLEAYNEGFLIEFNVRGR